MLPEPAEPDDVAAGLQRTWEEASLQETITPQAAGDAAPPTPPTSQDDRATLPGSGEATLAFEEGLGPRAGGPGSDDVSAPSIMATFKAEPSGASTYNVAERGTFARQRTLKDLHEADSGSGSADADYELLEKIGEGGMGIVYRARQCSMNREVAVKRIKSQSQTRDNREKFLLEAAITGELAHPNIVPIHDLGTNTQGDLFYSMMVVSGTSWQAVLRQKSRGENVEILLRVADAIAFAHSRHVVHRDLKPENVMLGAFGEVLVMDWGLAGRLTGTAPLPAGGTPAYMAPEMAQEFLRHIGQVRDAPDHANGKHSDIYLLGAILFHIVTGHPPHSSSLPGPSREQALDCLAHAARNDLAGVPAVEGEDAELLAIAFRAMATHPAERFASVGAFQEELRQYQNHAQSILLAGRAEKELMAGRRSRHYETLARAQFGFQDALELWPDNRTAEAGLRRAKLAFAQAAYEKQDYDLGISLLDPQDATDKEWHDRLLLARRARNARRSRLRLATVSSLLLLASLLGGALWFSRTLNGKNRQLAGKNVELDSTNQQLENTNQALDSTNQQLANTNQQLDRTNQQLETTNQQLAEQRDAAFLAKEAARYGRFVSDMALADARLAAGDLRRARDILTRWQQEEAASADPAAGAAGKFALDWEWHYLYHKCHPEVMTSFAGGQQALVAATPDGGHVATCAIDATGATPELILRITLADGRVVREQRRPLPGPERAAECLAVTDDARWVLLGLASRSTPGPGEPQADLLLWDGINDIVFMASAHHGRVHAIVTLPSSHRFLTAGLRRSPENLGVKLWSVGERGLTAETLHAELKNDGHNLSAAVTALSLSHDGRRLADLALTARRAFPDQPYRLVIRELDGAGAGTGAGAERARKATLLPPGLPPVNAMAFRPAHADELWLACDEQLWVARVGADLSVELQGPSPTPHVQPISALAFSDGGGQLFTAGRDATLTMWDLGAAGWEKRLLGHGSAIMACAVAPAEDELLLISSDAEGEVRRWHPERYRDELIVRPDPSWGPVRAATTGRNYSAVGTALGRVGLWDLSGQPLGELSLGHQQPRLRRVLFSPAAQTLLTVAEDGSVWSIDPASGMSAELLPPQDRGAFDPQNDIMMSSDGRWLARITRRGEAQEIWRCDLPAAVVTREPPLSQTPIHAGALDSRGALTLVTGNREAEFRFRRLADLAPLLGERKFTDCLHLQRRAEDEAHVAVCRSGGRCLLLSWMDAGQAAREVEIPWSEGARLWSSPGGGQLVVAQGDSGELRCYDTKTLGLAAPPWPRPALAGELRDVAWDEAEDRLYLLCAGAPSVWVWDLRRESLQPHLLSARMADAPPTGLLAAGAGRLVGYSPSGLHLWDEATGEEQLRWQPQSPLSAIFSLGPDPVTQREGLLTFSQDGVLRVWDVEDLVGAAGSGKAHLLRSAFRPASAPIGGVAFVSATNRCWLWWQTPPSGAAVAEFLPWSGAIREGPQVDTGDEPVTALAGQSETVVLGGAGGSVWLVPTGAGAGAARAVHCAATLSEAVTQLSLSPGEDRLAVGGLHRLRVAALADGRPDDATALELPAVPIAANALRCVTFSPTGRRLLVGRADGSLILWHIDPRVGLRQELIALREHKLALLAAQFTGSGDRLTSCDARQCVVRFTAGWPDGQPAAGGLSHR